MLYDRKAGTGHAALIVEIRAGTGGDEAALFARDLYEMYRRFAEQMNWKFEILDLEPTELGGFREVSFSVAGEGAFRHLQFEGGVHRVQRVPETEAQGRIHTSTATVAVLPEPEEVDIVIRTEDLLDRRDAVGRTGRPAPEQDRERGADHPPADRASSSIAATSGASTRTSPRPCGSSAAGCSTRCGRAPAPNATRPAAP